MSTEDKQVMPPEEDKDHLGQEEVKVTAEGQEVGETSRIHHLETELQRAQEERDSYKQKADEFYDRFLRAMAELDNYRKRTERLFEDRVLREKSEFILGLLDVVDNFELFLKASARQNSLAEGFGSFVKGVEMIMRQFLDVLSKEGVTPIECAVGQEVDPAVHEVVEAVEGAGESGTIVAEIRKGYMYRGKLLRAARVKAAK